MLHERSKRLEADMLGENLSALQESTSGFWVRQKSADGAAIINANSSREQGAQLGGVSVYTFDGDGHFQAAHRGARARRCSMAIGSSTTRAFMRAARRPTSRTAIGSPPI